MKHRQSIISRKYGVRSVRHGPGSDAALGFDDSEEFPIQRNNFPNLIVDIPPQTENEEDRDWTVEIRYIKVTSPNWDRTDTQRTWRGKYRQNDQDKFAVFHVDDDMFWDMVESNKISSAGIDSLKIQWAFVQDNGRRKLTHVLNCVLIFSITIPLSMICA